MSFCKKPVFYPVFLLVLLCLFGLSCEREGSENGNISVSALDSTEDTTDSDPEEVFPVTDRAEVILRAIQAAYPDRIREVAHMDDDWTIVVYNERFYYAGGRFLPSSLLHRVQEFTPLFFYNYPAELPPFVESSPEENARMREQEARRQNSQQTSGSPATIRSTHFFDALWRTKNQHEAYENVKQIRFLGNPVMIHYSILTQISLVEQQILRLANSNPAVRRWVDSIGIVEGWVWRNVAETENRSFHAYGAAIDLLPANLGGLQTYWLWSTRYYPDWWNIPYTRRYHPPEEVIKIFESFGFVWGGKWRRFDTMHFEYRPEVMILSGIPMINLLDLD